MLGLLPGYLSKLHANHDEDSVDRINYIYSNILLLAFALLLTAKSYIGKPLQCWVPAQFKGGWETYIENHCLIENTYFVRMDENLPDVGSERRIRELAYYQWIPFILILQAACCYAPRLVWKVLNSRSGINLTAFIPMALPTKKVGGKKILKDVNMDYSPLVERIGNHASLAIDNRVKFGMFVTILYMIVKFLWLINVFVQFWILNIFLGPQYTLWGIGILIDLVNNRDWSVSGHFPRVTFCDVEVREMGNVHNWTVQCVLMVNMFAEKVFLFLCDVKIDGFINCMLRKDGVTILRLISDNCGDLAVAEIVYKLWDMYQQRAPERFKASSDGESYVSEESDAAYVDDFKKDYDVGSMNE
ncbi:unnamed protein product [Anisakis simplex]|uniref:Innexin n=1 Tax=Anisakis simplex TaxID=6269 RepID=A0A0M3JR88_ANISI|nr:unnamed protein product [Anisakis simplex]